MSKATSSSVLLGLDAQQRRTGSVVLSLAVRTRLAAEVKSRGEAAVLAELECSRSTLARALGGLTVRRATSAMLAGKVGL
jgi:hypothetical protein